MVVLPNCVHEELLKIARPPRGERVTVGWSGGTSHLRDFRYVAPMLSRFLTRNPQVDFHFVGADYSPMRGVEGPAGRGTRRGRRTCGTSTRASTSISGSRRWTRPGSSTGASRYLRALEYAARGIPVVASDCERVPRVRASTAVTGFLVRYDHEWGRYLRDLVNDEAMRAEMGAAAKRLAAEHTIQERYGAWEQAFRRSDGTCTCRVRPAGMT